MLVAYEQMGEEAKAYVFPSSRKFYPQELPQIKNRTEEFCRDLDAQICVIAPYEHFLLFFVAEDTPLDSDKHEALIGFVQELEKEFGLLLLDKINVVFKQGPHVQRKEMPEFKKLIRNRSVSKKTVVFDPMIRNKGEYEEFWESPAEYSWIAHLF